MASPTYVNKSAFASGTGALSVGAVASVVVDDLLLLFVESANQAIATPSGWTQAPSSPQFTGTAAAAGGVRLAVFYKWATGADTTQSVADSGNHTTAIKMAFRGVDTTNPFNTNAGSTQAATTAMSFPGVTTTVADCLIVHACAQDTDANSTATSGAPTNGNLTSLTERHDQTVASGVGGGLVVLTGIKATAGATGNTTSTGSTSVTHAYVTLALAPTVLVERTGSMSVTETGVDTATGSGDVLIDGALSVSETGTDSLTASGTVRDPAVTGSMSVSEVGVDTATGTGDVIVRGSLSASEAGQDTAVGSGDVYISGALTATEGGTDSFNANGFGIVQTIGSISVTESGSDTLTATGDVYVQGVLSATESSDTASGSGNVNVRGSLTVSEVGADTFSGSGELGLLTTTGVMSVTEGQDTFSATYVVPAERPRAVGGRYTDAQAQAEWEAKDKWRKQAEAMLTESVQELVPELGTKEPELGTSKPIPLDDIVSRLDTPLLSLADLLADAKLLQLEQAQALEAAMAVRDVMRMAELAYLAELAVQQEKDAIAAFIMFMD